MITEVEVNRKLINEFKGKHNLTVREFIAQSGISMTIYYNIFANKKKIGMRHIVKLAKFMKVEIKDLLDTNNADEKYLEELKQKNIIVQYLKDNNLSKYAFSKIYGLNVEFVNKLIKKDYSKLHTNSIIKILEVLNKIN